MALKNIIAPRQQVLNAQGNPVAGGQVFLYQPGTTTFITSYMDSGLVQPHTNPVRLSGSGRSNIWITRDCDVRILDRNGNLILEELNANPDDIGAEQAGGLVPNGSFEIDSDADLIPDGWTLVNEAGSSNAIDTAESTDGAQSFRFTSSGSGGGSLTTTDFFPVNDVDQLRVNLDMKASVATVLNIVRVEWYDISFTPISNSDIYSSTANPLTFTSFNLLATPPALARFAKLRLIGGDPSVALAGSSWWDRINVFYPAVVSGVFDNITIQNNQIITTNLNGDLELGPNGTGAVNVNQVNPVTLADAKNALNIGTDQPATTRHLALGLGGAGITILQSKADAVTVDGLDLNPLGGRVRVGAQSGIGDVHLYDDGAVVTRTLPAASGGLEANNTLTGAGFERVLTSSEKFISGALIDSQVFTASGTWTKPAGAQTIEVFVVGGGGGGGGAGETTLPTTGCHVGGSGGGGACVWARFLASQTAATETVTVGAAGTGGVGFTGASATGGGESRFTVGGSNYFRATGGNGGSIPVNTTDPGQSGNGGQATNPFGITTIQIALQFGQAGNAGLINGTRAVNGPGGFSPSPFGSAPGASREISTNGVGGSSAWSYGAGGAGAIQSSVGTRAQRTGGLGRPGLVIVNSYS